MGNWHNMLRRRIRLDWRCRAKMAPDLNGSTNLDKSMMHKNGDIMNLMFWKKKPGNGNGAKDAHGGSSMNKKERESLDFAAAKQQSSESNPESPNPESPEQDAPVETGLAARIKSKFTSFTQHFRKEPVFRAGEDYAAPTSDSKPADPETPATPGLVERIKSNAFISQHKKLLISTLLPLSLIVIVYAAWNIVFSPPASEPALHSTDEALVHEPPPPIKSPHAVSPQSEQPQTEAEVPKKKSEEAQASVDAPKKEGSEPIQTEADMFKKKSEEAQARVEPPKKEGAEQPQAEAKALIETSKDVQARAEELKKKSEAAQAQAEALKKESEAAQARAEELRKKEEEKARVDALKKSRQTYSRGEITVGNDDPEAAAKSLKEAIEAMNADSGATPRKLSSKRPLGRPPRP